MPNQTRDFSWQKQTDRQRIKYGLTPKSDGWYKSVNGKTRYICRPLPIEEAASLVAGKIATIKSIDAGKFVAPEGISLQQLVDLFLERMLLRVKTSIPKKMARRTYDDYVDCLTRFCEAVGPTRAAASCGPDEFTVFIQSLAGLAQSTLRREIQYVDRLFNWAGPGKKTMNLIPFVNRGPDWIKPSDDMLDQEGTENDKAYTIEQIAKMFEVVKEKPMLNAAAHLGLNCAMIPKDIGTLPDSVLDMTKRLIVFPRGKTGVGRICPMLQPTFDAMETWLKFRKRFKCDASADGLVFRTRQGLPLARTIFDEKEADQATDHNALTRTWSRIVGLPFSGLRSTFATFADEWYDERAIDVVMGHKAGNKVRHVRVRSYAKRFNPERAWRLVEFVWPQLFGLPAPKFVISAGASDARHG